MGIFFSAIKQPVQGLNPPATPLQAPPGHSAGSGYASCFTGASHVNPRALWSGVAGRFEALYRLLHDKIFSVDEKPKEDKLTPHSLLYHRLKNSCLDGGVLFEAWPTGVTP